MRNHGSPVSVGAAANFSPPQLEYVCAVVLHAALGHSPARSPSFFACVEQTFTHQEAEGKALRDSAEFAEREASVAAREEEMAIRLGQSGPEELEDLAGKTRDCRVIVRWAKELEANERRAPNKATTNTKRGRAGPSGPMLLRGQNHVMALWSV